MSVAIASHAGLIAHGLRHIKRKNFASIAQERTEYVWMTEFLRRRVETLKSGWELEWEMTTEASNTFQMVGLYETLTPSQTDAVIPVRTNWGAARAHKSYDELEIDINMGESRILDIMETRDHRMQLDLAEGLENQGWLCPASGDSKSVKGMQYWLFTYPETGAAYAGSFLGTSTGGFLNRNRTSYSGGPGGVDATTYTRSGNWNQQYTSMTYADMVYKMRVAMDQTNFQSPSPFPELRKGSPQRVIYTTRLVRRTMEDLARTQNENIGKDLDAYNGAVTVRNVPVVSVPFFDQYETGTSGSGVLLNPIYGWDWSQLYPCVEPNWNMIERLVRSGSQPTAVTVMKMLVFSIKCLNRKYLWALSQ